MGDSFARQMLTGIQNTDANVSSQLLKHLVTHNGTVAINATIVADQTMSNTGILGIGVSDLTTATIMTLIRNNTDSYLNNGSSLAAGTAYDFDKYVNQNDVINFKLNASASLNLELYFRR